MKGVKTMFKQIQTNKIYLASLVILSLVSFHCHKGANGKQNSKPDVSMVTIVQAKAPEPVETITLPGNLKAWYEAPLYAQVSGYVKMWYKDYGAEVEKGDLLAEVQAPTLDAEYAQARADLDSQDARFQLADVTANRYLALRNANAVSEQSISVAVADKNAEKAKLHASVQNLKKYGALIGFKKIVAPFKGIVTERNINVGDYVNKDGNLTDTRTKANLFTVSDIHKLRLFVSVPGAYAYLLKNGLTADVKVAQVPNRIFKANFLTIANGFDPNTQTVIAQFTIDNKDHTLWPGSYATVNLSAPVKKNVYTIPTSALVFNENGTQVAVVTNDNKVHFKAIRVNKITDAFVEVLEGVTEEDRIINNPKASFLERDLVKVVTQDEKKLENEEKLSQIDSKNTKEEDKHD